MGDDNHKPLDEIADEINALEETVGDKRLQQAQLIALAYRQIKHDWFYNGGEGDASMVTKNFQAWAERLTIGLKEAKRLLAIGASEDPKAAMTEYRRKQREAQKAHREKKKTKNLRKFKTPDEVIKSLKAAVKHEDWQTLRNTRGQNAMSSERCCQLADNALRAIGVSPLTLESLRRELPKEVLEERLRVTETDPVCAFRKYMIDSSRARRGKLIRSFIDEFKITEAELSKQILLLELEAAD